MLDSPPVDRFTLSQKVFTGLRGSYGRRADGRARTSLTGMSLINPLSLSVARLFGGKSMPRGGTGRCSSAPGASARAAVAAARRRDLPRAWRRTRKDSRTPGAACPARPLHGRHRGPPGRDRRVAAHRRRPPPTRTPPPARTVPAASNRSCSASPACRGSRSPCYKRPLESGTSSAGGRPARPGRPGVPRALPRRELAAPASRAPRRAAPGGRHGRCAVRQVHPGQRPDRGRTSHRCGRTADRSGTTTGRSRSPGCSRRECPARSRFRWSATPAGSCRRRAADEIRSVVGRVAVPGAAAHPVAGDRPGAAGYEADAVLHLVRHLGDDELGAAAGGRCSPRTHPGLLSRADETAGGRTDALLTAKRIARRRRTEPRSAPLCQDVLAISARIAHAGRTLREEEYATVAAIAGLPTHGGRGASAVGRPLSPAPPSRRRSRPGGGRPCSTAWPRRRPAGRHAGRTTARSRAALGEQLVRQSGLTELQGLDQRPAHRPAWRAQGPGGPGRARAPAARGESSGRALTWPPRRAADGLGRTSSASCACSRRCATGRGRAPRRPRPGGPPAYRRRRRGALRNASASTRRTPPRSCGPPPSRPPSAGTSRPRAATAGGRRAAEVVLRSCTAILDALAESSGRGPRYGPTRMPDFLIATGPRTPATGVRQPTPSGRGHVGPVDVTS
jgi:hypothetical protein